MNSNISLSNLKICGVVILYHPDEYILSNIQSYLRGLEVLYVFDNSETYNTNLIIALKNIPEIEYISNNGNMGIAFTLNAAIKKAKTNGYQWILTMDQDSSFGKGDLEKMLGWIKENPTSDVGIVTPMHSLSDLNNPKYMKYAHLTAMTSGNLLNIELFDKIGRFDERLFIDEVDAEFCLRMNLKGFQLMRMTDIILEHSLGSIEKTNIGIKSIQTTNHSATRRYYITRNRLLVWTSYFKYYPKLSLSIFWYSIKEIVKIILLENKKATKLRCVLLGIFDFMRGNYGKANFK